jgi:hypothetical protein
MFRSAINTCLQLCLALMFQSCMMDTYVLTPSLQSLHVEYTSDTDYIAV